jgi:hypothetical protein
MVYSQEYAGCCGALEIQNFYGPVREEGRTLKRIVECMESTSSSGAAFGSVILDEEQVKKYGKLLKENGFRRISSAINPGTGNKLTFFLHTRKSKKVDQDVLEANQGF